MLMLFKVLDSTWATMKPDRSVAQLRTRDRTIFLLGLPFARLPLLLLSILAPITIVASSNNSTIFKLLRCELASSPLSDVLCFFKGTYYSVPLVRSSAVEPRFYVR